MSSIAIYVPSLRGGGAERMMVILANGFSTYDHRFDLVLAKAEGPYLKDVANNVHIVDLNASRAITSLPNLINYLKTQKPSALLSALNYANVIAVAAHRLSRTKSRLVVSERANFSASRKNAKNMRARLMLPFMRWAYPKADALVAISRGVADDLIKNIGLHLKYIQVIYNPADSDHILEMIREPVNHPWFNQNSPPVIIGVGRLTQQKGFDLLIRAFSLLSNERNVRLMILGEGELRSELEKLVQDLGLVKKVFLPGFVNNPFAYIHRSSLFVLSSRWEGFGNVLVEAMACGTPIVSTDCPSGPAEILENGRWGRMVPVGDEIAMAEAMVATLDETDHPNVVARAAEFNVDRAVNEYLKVLLPEKNEEQAR